MNHLNKSGTVKALALFILAIAFTVAVAFALFGTSKKSGWADVKQEKTRQIVQTENAETYDSAVNEGRPEDCRKISDDPDLLEKCLDNAYAALASSSSDVAYCEKISAADAKARCRDSFLYDEALRKRSEDACSKISQPALREACVKNVVFAKIESAASSGPADAAVCRQLSWEDKAYCVKRIENDSDIRAMKEAVAVSDPGKCVGIKNAVLAKTCSDSANMAVALRDKDSKSCERISEEGKRAKCESVISAARDSRSLASLVTAGDENGCSKLENPSIRSKCVDVIRLKAAVASTDAKACSGISDRSLADQCLKAVKTKAEAKK